MTKTGYAWDMSTTPSDPDYINTKAFERFMRAFDSAITGKYGLDVPEQPSTKTLMVELRERVETLEQQRQARQSSFWYTFPPLRNIIHLRDNIRLRRYNREWIKNNIH